jgi:hypothetical protein
MEQDSQKDMTKHMNAIKWILIGGILIVLFFVLTVPVVPGAKPRIESICSNIERLSIHTKIDCMIYDLTGRVLDPRKL